MGPIDIDIWTCFEQKQACGNQTLFWSMELYVQHTEFSTYFLMFLGPKQTWSPALTTYEHSRTLGYWYTTVHCSAGTGNCAWNMKIDTLNIPAHAMSIVFSCSPYYSIKVNGCSFPLSFHGF